MILTEVSTMIKAIQPKEAAQILADNGFITDGLPIIYGLEPAEITTGRPVASANEHKNEAFAEIIASMVAKSDNNIMSVDLSDEHSIIVNYKNDMIFKMGNWNDVEYKLGLADTVMNDESVKGKKGYLTMIGTNQCSFRDSDKLRSILAIPDSEEVLAVIALGYRAQEPGTPNHLALDEIVKFY